VVVPRPTGAPGLGGRDVCHRVNVVDR
jgi:hypothetical protein